MSYFSYNGRKYLLNDYIGFSKTNKYHIDMIGFQYSIVKIGEKDNLDICNVYSLDYAIRIVNLLNTQR